MWYYLQLIIKICLQSGMYIHVHMWIGTTSSSLDATNSVALCLGIVSEAQYTLTSSALEMLLVLLAIKVCSYISYS